MPRLVDLSKPSFSEVERSNVDPLSVVVFVIVGAVVLVSILFSILDYRATDGTFAGATQNSLFECFSVGRNARAIFYSKEYSDPHLDTLDGLCIFSMMWVICASCFYYFGISPLTNRKTYEHDSRESYFFHVMLAATFAINVFFFISGFLCAVKLTEKLEKAAEEGSTVKTVLLCYLHRYLRLLPLCLFAVLAMLAVIPFIYSGQPLSSIIQWQQDKCKTNFWQNLLLIQNFFTQRDTCLPWLWYFACDFQLFLLTPLLILLYNRNNKLGVFATLGLSLASLVAQVVTVAVYDLPVNQEFFGTKTALDVFHSKPYVNLLAYSFGLLLGWHYLSSKADESEDYSNGIAAKLFGNSIAKFIFVLIGTVLISACVILRYFLRNATLTVQSTYLVAGNFLFLAGVIMIFYPAILGKSKTIYYVFGASVWRPLRKLSFGAYIFHIFVILTEKAMDYHANYYTFIRVLLSAIHVFALAYFVSLVLTIFFEAPLRELQRAYLFGTKTGKDDAEELTEVNGDQLLNTTEPLLNKPINEQQ